MHIKHQNAFAQCWAHLYGVKHSVWKITFVPVHLSLHEIHTLHSRFPKHVIVYSCSYAAQPAFSWYIKKNNRQCKHGNKEQILLCDMVQRVGSTAFCLFWSQKLLGSVPIQKGKARSLVCISMSMFVYLMVIIKS